MIQELFSLEGNKALVVGGGDLEVGDARFDGHATIGDVDVEHAVEPRQADDDAARNGQRPARQPGAVPARDKGNPLASAELYDLLHLLR